MRRVRRVLVLATLGASLCLCAAGATAAAPASLNAGYVYVGETEDRDSGAGPKTQRNRVSLAGRAPASVGRGTLVLGVTYDGQFIDYRDVPAGVDEDDLPDSLHALDVSAGYGWTVWGGWAAVVTAGTGIHSDFEDVGGRDLVHMVSALATKRFGEKGRNEFGLGVGYSDLLGEKQAYPLLALTWDATEEIYVDAFIPERLDLGYRVAPAWKAGVEGRLKGYQYRLTEDEPWDDGVIAFREVRVGPFVEWAFLPRGTVRLAAGLVTGQKFEFRDDDGDKVIDGDLEDTAYASVAVNLAL